MTDSRTHRGGGENPFDVRKARFERLSERTPPGSAISESMSKDYRRRVPRSRLDYDLAHFVWCRWFWKELAEEETSDYKEKEWDEETANV